MTDHDNETPTTATALLTELGEEHTRAMALPMPEHDVARGWQMIAASRTAGFARALHALNDEDPNKADEIAAWFDGQFGEGPNPVEHTDWLIRNVVEDRAEFDRWVENGRKQAADAERAAGEQRDAQAKQLADLVRDLAHGDPCRIDHNGDCQEHFWFPSDGTPCPHGRAQALFPDIKE